MFEWAILWKLDLVFFVSSICRRSVFTLTLTKVFLQEESRIKYDHLLLAILDPNPYLSDASKQATPFSTVPSVTISLFNFILRRSWQVVSVKFNLKEAWIPGQILLPVVFTAQEGFAQRFCLMLDTQMPYRSYSYPE